MSSRERPATQHSRVRQVLWPLGWALLVVIAAIVTYLTLVILGR